MIKKNRIAKKWLNAWTRKNDLAIKRATFCSMHYHNENNLSEILVINYYKADMAELNWIKFQIRVKENIYD